MKVRITAGQVHLSTTGIDLDRKSLRRLLMDVASIASAMADDPVAPEPVNLIGFSAHVERAPDMSSETYFTDDEDGDSNA